MGSLSSLRKGSTQPFAFGKTRSPMGRGISTGMKRLQQISYRDWQISIFVVQRGVAVKRFVYRASLTGPLVTIKHVIEQQHSEAAALRSSKRYIDEWHREFADYWSASDNGQLDRFRFLKEQMERQKERDKKLRRDQQWEDPDQVEWLE